MAVAIALGLSWAPVARAQTPDAIAQADAAFKDAMQLRAVGHEAEACPRFAESKRLAPAVGVTLYLADCYEKTGRNASAWREFREAEKMARERGDQRADVAAARAGALEPKLNRLVVSTPADAAKSGEQLQLDGAPLPPEYWNSPLAEDPGDHTVTVIAAGQPPRTLTAHVDQGNLSTMVRVEATNIFVAADTASAAVASTAQETPAPRRGSAAGQWAGIGLALIGGAGIGVGTWLLTSKVREMDNGQLCDPHLRPHALPEGIAAVTAGGLAVVSGIVVYYVNRPGRTEVSLSPAMVPGGGGATVHGNF
jgi:hypothetical protein